MEDARIGIKVKCVKNDGADDYYGFAKELRWHIGDELIVTDILIAPYGTFLCNYKGQNINIKRCEFVDANIEENLETVRLITGEKSTYSDAEIEIKSIRAYGNGCIGCRRHDKDVMISFTNTLANKGESRVTDLFLTQEQAEFLLKELSVAVNQNNSESSEK
jgi:hypothetical protein